ncbi:hypothetical protein [Candidatus Terasakiella magnetica]|uniref:hypothetical protein n=1 Tax=Candidatus Terasakiella magnetica TaxID=1867952 RepID=UPI000840AB7D|nr:hypothetical protein [Candidatus Terasakiella magnetica]
MNTIDSQIKPKIAPNAIPRVAPIAELTRYTSPLITAPAMPITMPNWIGLGKSLYTLMIAFHAAVSPIHSKAARIYKCISNSNQCRKSFHTSALVALAQFTSSSIVKSFKNKDLSSFKTITYIAETQGFKRLSAI